MNFGLWQVFLRLIGVAAFAFFFNTASSAQCPPCISDEPPMAGHGAHSSTDNRRVINITIDSSWNSEPGKTDTKIWNAVQCAIDQWNKGTDASGNTTGYFFQVNQSGKNTDITVVKQSPSGGGFTATSGSFTGGGPYTMKLDPSNTNRQPKDLCGSIAHEIGHTIGLAEWNTNFCSGGVHTIMDLVSPNGQNNVNDVQPNDVAQSNANLNPTSRSSCKETVAHANDIGQGTEPTCSTPAPNSSCECNANGTWTCVTCQGNPPNDTCSCDEAGQWNCECDGFPRSCADGTSEVCYNGGWTCGTVTVSACTGHAPVCEDGYPAECVNDTWDCPGSQVCPP